MKNVLFLFTLIISLLSNAQGTAYFTKYRNFAEDLACHYGIPADVMLAVAYIESGGGTSKVAQNLNNHFGIVGSCNYNVSKYKSRYKYFKSIEHSYVGFCDLVASKKFYLGLKGSNNTDKWVRSIAATGYAADANLWSNTVIGMIKKYGNKPALK